MSGRRCVRCGCDEEAHVLGITTFVVSSEQRLCPGFVPPERWWRRWLTAVLDLVR